MGICLEVSAQCLFESFFPFVGKFRERHPSPAFGECRAANPWPTLAVSQIAVLATLFTLFFNLEWGWSREFDAAFAIQIQDEFHFGVIHRSDEFSEAPGTQFHRATIFWANDVHLLGSSGIPFSVIP